MERCSRIASARALAVAGLATLAFQPLRAQEQKADFSVFRRYQAAEPTLTEAAKQVQAHRFDDAQRILAPVLKETPDHAGAHFLLAMMAYEDRDFTSALAHIETSERSLKDLRQLYGKFMVTMKANDDAEARATQDSLDSIVNADFDGMTDVMTAKRSHLKALEQKKGGLFSRETPFAVPSVYSFLHGNCLYRLGRAPEAAAQYQQAIQSDPSNAKAWNNLVNLYREAKDFDQARATLAKAEAAGVAIQPNLKQSVLEGK